jgi:bifunctional non-homologous end joining protein LigD
VNFCICGDLPTLVWMANLADLELHPSLSLAKKIERPTMMAFDLDPGEPAALLECCQVALALRETLSQLGLECFPKTSGSKGMQVYVPINQPKVTYDHTKPLSKALAQHMEREHPDLVVSSQKKSLRPGKVLIDWSQNDAAKTTVSVYSLRAKERPTVSTPLEWEEVESALRSSDADALVFDADQVLERVVERGDLFSPVLQLRQRLPEL